MRYCVIFSEFPLWHDNRGFIFQVKYALKYQWSSYQSYTGIENIPFLTTSWVLGQFAKTELSARKKFAEFVARGEGEGHRKGLYSGERDRRILGDDGFVERVLAKRITMKKPHLGVVVRYVCKDSGVTEEELSAPSCRRKVAEVPGMIG